MQAWLKRKQVNFLYLSVLRPVWAGQKDSIKTIQPLPVGHYAWVTLHGYQVQASTETVSRLSHSNITSGKHRLLNVFNATGELQAGGNAFLNGKRLRWNAVNKGYELPHFRKERPDKLLRIESAGDTLFAWLNQRGDYYYRYRPFQRLPVIRQVLTVPAFIRRVVNGEQFSYRERRRQQKKAFDGFVVFNKPVYKSNDTLRFKAWLTDKKGRPETKPKDLSVSYRYKNNNKTIPLGQLKTVSAGSYVFDWPLPDSLPADTRYTLTLNGPSKYGHFSADFSMEEYELPNITQFSMRPEKNKWLRKDSLRITLQAKDASELFIPDGMVELTAITQNISQIHPNAVFVPDTLWQKKLALSTDNPTEVYIPANQFPEADIKFTLTAVLRNSSNEIKQVSETMEQFTRLRRIDLQRTGGKLHISYLENDTVVPRRALVSISGEELDLDTSFLLPATIPLHPMAVEYDVEALDEKGNTLASENIQLPINELSAALEPLAPAGDSIGFRLSNPAELPVWVSLMKGRQTIWTRLITAASYEWKEEVSRRNMYQVRARFLYNSQEEERVENLGALYNILQVNARVASGNSPGAKDSLLVQVTDYKGRPVAEANITATAQNLQLKNKFREPALPLRMTYRKQRRLRPISPLEVDEAFIRQDSTAALYPALASLLGCDTMFYYQRLFSADPLYIAKTPIESVFPEIALHVYEKGKPLAAYISWLNKQPAAIFWQNDGRPESHAVYPSYTKAAIRVKDRLIEIDSLYMQPHYKHDVFINAAGGPHKNISIRSMPDTLLYAEKQELEKYFIAVEMNREAKDAWIWNATGYRQLTGSQPITIAGPFKAGDSIRIFNAGKIDMPFLFESGYQYRLTQNMARLEKKSLLPGKIKLGVPTGTWNIGDTIASLMLPPTFPAGADRSRNYVVSTGAYQTESGRGMLQLFLQTDSLIRYTILLSTNESDNPLILSGRQTIMHNLLPGAYKIILVDHYDKAWSSDSLVVKADGINAYKLFPQRFSANNSDAAYTWHWQMQELRRLADKPLINEPETRDSTISRQELMPGTARISGLLTDIVSGDPIAGGVVRIKGTNRVTSTDAKGRFLLNNIPPGEFVLVANSVGYQSVEIKVQAVAGQETQQAMAMRVSESRLDEVIVTALGVSRKRSVTASLSSVPGSALQGNVAGVMVQSDPGANASIIIRGASSVNSSTGPVYVIDGVPVDVLPAGLDTSSLSIEILKSSAAVALYGSRAVNGAILISTGKNNGAVIRTVFRDYAYWKPNTVTDSKGKAIIPISYPENITSWQHMVFAAGKKGKYGSSHGVTKIFKPMQAILQVPSFLVSADSISLIGKAINYTSGEKQVHGRFNGKEATPGTVSIAPGASQVMYASIKAPAAPDTLRPSFEVIGNGITLDGEERSIPVLPAGSFETKGAFFVLDKDISIQFHPAYNDIPITVYTENNLVDLLEKELEQLRKYPQACMEQTANKMWGLLMMRDIKNKTKQPFNYQKQIDKLQQRLFENQLYNGGWSWWGPGYANISITAKVLQALRYADSTETTKRAIREGNIYLQNQLAQLPRAEKLEALLCLSEGKHVYPYQFALDSLPFDSLSVHQQWQFVRIKQNAGLSYEKEIAKLWKKRKESYTGALYWGTANWYWQNNINATMVIAAKVIRNSDAYKQYLPRVKQYLLTEKKTPYYLNTIEQAEITHVLLEDALTDKYATGQPATLTINGKTTDQFPQQWELPPATSVTITKKGAGLVFAGFSQQKWETDPPKRDSLFNVATTLQQGSRTWGEKENWLISAGEKIALRVEITARKEAEFIELEIPIPAGCSYDNKNYNSFSEYREYRKEKLLIYIEKMEAGKHVFTVPLQTRFAGKFSINPAKVSLMYFPVFTGNNRIKSVLIENSR